MSKNIIGLDIGHASMRVVGLTGKNPVFVGSKEIEVEAKFIQKEGFENFELLGSILRQALAQASPAKISGSDVYVTISESVIFRKLIEMPVVSVGDELTNAVRAAAVEYLPSGLDNMDLDYQILGVNEQNKLQQIMLVAVNKKMTMDVLQLLESAKLTAKAFEPKPESVGRALVSSHKKEAILLVDIGQSNCTVSAYDQGVARVTSALSVGMMSILDPEDLNNPDKVKEKLPRLIGQIADEVDHVVKFYTNRTVHTGKISEILLSGAGSLIEVAGDSLAKTVDYPISKSKPIITVPDNCDRRFYGALGAALYPWQQTGQL